MKPIVFPKSTPTFEKFIEKFQVVKKINTEHTRLVSFITVGILEELDWGSESTIQRMCLAAMLHDISLPEEIFSKMVNNKNIEKLNPEDKKTYYKHPELSAHLAKNFETAEGGIELYILEHHETPDGTGFPRKLQYKTIHPLSAVLHLAEYASDLIWDCEFDNEKVLKELNLKKNYYSKGVFRKPYDALVKSLSPDHQKKKN